MKHLTKTLTCLAIFVGTLSLATAGWAYWTSVGSGSSSATVGSLTAPVLSTPTPSGTTVPLSWSASPSPGTSSVSYYVLRDGAAASTACGSSASAISATSCSDTGVAIGTHSYTVTALYRSWTAISSSVSVTVNALPTLSSISPAAGPLAGGTSVVIAGANFTAGSVVKFGSSTASATVNSPTQITATAPAVGVAGTLDVTVTTSGGTSTTSAAGIYTYGTLPAPAITSINPTTGPPTGGTAVVITGTSFTSASTVKFGATSAGAVTVNSSTQITATSPAGTSGTVDVTVTNAAGTSATSGADIYTYTALPTPTVSSISPASGAAAGGTSVTITGTNFTSGSTVKFGSTAASAVTVKGATQITAISPAGTTPTVDITVTNASGTSSLSAADKFSYQPRGFSISSVPSAPANGTPSNGDQIVYSFSDVMDPASIMAGWTGSSTSVNVNFAHGSPNDTLTIASVNLGIVDLGVTNGYVQNGNHPYSSTATMVMTTVSGRSVITVTLTQSPSGNPTDTNAHSMVWTPSSSAKSASGALASLTTPVTQATAAENF